MTLLPVKAKILLSHNRTKLCTWVVYEVMTLLPVKIGCWNLARVQIWPHCNDHQWWVGTDACPSLNKVWGSHKSHLTNL